jgi:putative phosphoserine phosphatase/1-acylglycerol-3-phosphate O-acyltransferase
MQAPAMMLAGEREETVQAIADRAFQKHWRSKIFPEAQDLIAAHRKRGHRVVILSSATRFQVAPIAREIEIDDVLCTELEVRDSVITGELGNRPCWGENKLHAAQEYVERIGANLKNCYFYTDAYEDLPLLERVGHPRAINPDAKLEAHFQARQWPVCHFTSRGRSSAEDVLRTVLMWGSFAPAAALGAFSWLRSRSVRQAASTTFQTWADFGLMMAGVELNVQGRKHLWEHRPAIFVFNHQSMMDGFILPALLQGAFTVMGKKEAGNIAVLRKTFEAAGFILFDRNDPKQAREACDRAAEQIRSGVSLLIAPEGTRSYGNRVQKFKKGAFHVALQTRVPIVPVVIRNATELWPRGANFPRPGTVEVEVLPPIPTTDWRAETLQLHVDEIRHLFLERLGQEHDA